MSIQTTLPRSGVTLRFAASSLIAAVALLFAVPVFITGEVYIPGRAWATGQFQGLAAYLMACSWVALAISSLLTGMMCRAPRRYAQFKKWRDTSFLLFALMFVFATAVVAMQRIGILPSVFVGI